MELQTALLDGTGTLALCGVPHAYDKLPPNSESPSHVCPFPIRARSTSVSVRKKSRVRGYIAVVTSLPPQSAVVLKGRDSKDASETSGFVKWDGMCHQVTHSCVYSLVDVLSKSESSERGVRRGPHQHALVSASVVLERPKQAE